MIEHLTKYNVNVHTQILQAPSGNHRGGRVTVERLARHMSHAYHSYDRITTLVDFYGFRDRNGRGKAEIETAILDAMQSRTTGFDPRFVLPYVQMYEFEGLLFSEIAAFAWVQDGWNQDVKAKLQKVRDAFNTPEDINDNPKTAPSKRILAIFGAGAYSKTEHGPLIAEVIGLEKIRSQCPAFDDWLGRLEAWGQS
ncbi:MAG: DUF4276 family protein [Magnetococcales bacterium]|nr:DUF4276 family protein [Magnetococcales bacterium]